MGGCRPRERTGCWGSASLSYRWRWYGPAGRGKSRDWRSACRVRRFEGRSRDWPVALVGPVVVVGTGGRSASEMPVVGPVSPANKGFAGVAVAARSGRGAAVASTHLVALVSRAAGRSLRQAGLGFAAGWTVLVPGGNWAELGYRRMSAAYCYCSGCYCRCSSVLLVPRTVAVGEGSVESEDPGDKDLVG